MNISKIMPYTREWFLVLRDYRAGGKVGREDLLDALNSQERPPEGATEILKALAAGTLKFKRGLKPHWGYKRPHWLKLEMHLIENKINDPSFCTDPEEKARFAALNRKAQAKRRDRVSVRDSAIRILAEQVGTDTRTLERILASD